MRYIASLPYKTVITSILTLSVFSGTTPAYAIQPAQPKVSVVQVKQESIADEIRVSGTVSSPRVSRLSTGVSGLVQNLHVDEGSVVKAGEILIDLDTQLETLSLQAAQAMVQHAKEQLSDTKRLLEEGMRLAEKDMISISELQSLQTKVKIDNASLQRYNAEKDLQKARLKLHRLIAPFDGVVSKRLVELGEWVKPGDATMELVANRNLRIDFQIPQEAFPIIDTTSEIRIELDAIPDKTLPGQIQTVIPYSKSDARTFLLRTRLTESNPVIAPGMSASGLLRLKTDAANITISHDTILRHPDGRATVWVVNTINGKHTVSERNVTTGSRFNDRISILDGLESGERIILEGKELLKDGQTVTLHNS